MLRTLLFSLAIQFAFAQTVCATPDAQTKAAPVNMQGGCTPEQRRAALLDLQRQALADVPHHVDSFDKATRRGGSLEGWRLSHGYAVLAGAGAIAVDNIKMKIPKPHALLYAPSPSSSSSDWLDFEHADGPYRLVGWAYMPRLRLSSAATALHCSHGVVCP